MAGEDLSIGMSNRQALKALKKAGVDKATRKQVKQFLKQDDKKISNPLELALLNSIKDGKPLYQSASSGATETKNFYGSDNSQSFVSEYKYENGAKGREITSSSMQSFSYEERFAPKSGSPVKTSGSIFLNRQNNQLSYNDSGYTKDGKSFSRELNIDLNNVKNTD